jgi:hypothetical protein
MNEKQCFCLPVTAFFTQMSLLLPLLPNSYLTAKLEILSTGKSTAAKKKSQNEDSSASDFDFDFGKPKAKKSSAEPKAKKTVVRKPKAKKAAGSDVSDEEGVAVKPKKPAAPRKPKTVKRAANSDSSADEGFAAKQVCNIFLLSMRYFKFPSDSDSVTNNNMPILASSEAREMFIVVLVSVLYAVVDHIRIEFYTSV